MCFYYRLSKKAVELEKRFEAVVDEIFANEFNAYAHKGAPVIIDKEPDKIKMYSWGLVPSRAKHANYRDGTINARIETLHEKFSYKDHIINRCIIPTDGFFEWQWLDPKGKEKQKYLITFSGSEIFSFAGLYAHWENAITGEFIDSYTLLTRKANELMTKIHNNPTVPEPRMPVILSPEIEKDWLSGTDVKEFQFLDTNLKADKC